MWRPPERILKELTRNEPPEQNAARKTCIMEHTSTLAVLTASLVIMCAADGLYVRSIPFTLLIAGIALLMVRSVHQAQNSAYYLGKYHGLETARHTRLGPEKGGEEPAPKELELETLKASTHQPDTANQKEDEERNRIDSDGRRDGGDAVNSGEARD